MEPIIAFTKVALPFGWLGNMAPYPVTYGGKAWRTTEALFQALRFEDESIRESIRQEKSPMAVKFIAKRHQSKMVVEPRSPADLDNMRLVLRLKLQAHPPWGGSCSPPGQPGSSRIAAVGPRARGCSGGRPCGRAGGSGRTGWGGSGRSCALPSANRAEPDVVGLSDWIGEVDRARRSG